MKKRVISLILASAMLLSVTGCSKKEQNLDLENITLEEYIDKVELPKNLTISIDPATVEERETAKVYDDVKYMEFDHEKMVDLLFKNPITEEIHYPDNEDAVTYKAKTDTMEEGSLIEKGGFTYHVEPEENAWGATYPPDFKEMYSNSSETLIGQFRGIYQSVDKELEFASREEIAAKATALINDMGISEIEVQDIYAYDMKAIQTAVKYGSSHGEDIEVKKSDEHYWMFFRQLVDGIPINRYGEWVIMDEGSGFASPTLFTLQYTEDGLQDGIGIQILESPAETDGTEETLISAAEALEGLKEYYGQGVLLKPYDVEDMELLYLTEFNDENGAFSLRPYWLVKTSYQQDYPDCTDWEDNPLEGEIKAYDFTYFDAVTGEYSTKSTSGKPIE